MQGRSNILYILMGYISFGNTIIKQVLFSLTQLLFVRTAGSYTYLTAAQGRGLNA
jgi:hypothetical protein